MKVLLTKPLFAWDALQDSPSLATVKEFLAAVPDAKLLEGLRLHRGRGRNDYPVHVLWGVLLLRIALRHVSFEATLGELRRNEHLRRLIGIESESGVPNAWNVSRFLDVLGQEPHSSELRRIFDVMIQRLGVAVPDLGKDTAGDSTALHARRKADQNAVKTEVGEGLPQPAGGRKEYTDDDGNITGARRFHAMVATVMIVHAAFATLLAAAPRRDGTLGKLRLGPIQRALAQRSAG
jgi:hypothetical protein